MDFNKQWSADGHLEFAINSSETKKWSADGQLDFATEWGSSGQLEFVNGSSEPIGEPKKWSADGQLDFATQWDSSGQLEFITGNIADPVTNITDISGVSYLFTPLSTATVGSAIAVNGASILEPSATDGRVDIIAELLATSELSGVTGRP